MRFRRSNESIEKHGFLSLSLFSVASTHAKTIGFSMIMVGGLGEGYNDFSGFGCG